MIKTILGFLVSISLLGCGPTRASLQGKIGALESEIVRMRSERVNVEAHAKALDDRLFILNKRLNKCHKDEDALKPTLKVVRLMAEAESEPPTERFPERDETAAKEEEAPFTQADDKPQALVLSGESFRTSPSRARMPSERRQAASLVSAEGFSSVGADNLGVATDTLNAAGEDPAMVRFNTAYRAYSNKQYAVALEGFSEFVKAYPDHHYADNALYWRGECYLAGGQMLRAIGEFERLASRYPQSDKVPSGLYRIGFVYDNLRDYRKAVEYYFKVVDRFPGTDAARRASRRVFEIENRANTESGIVPTSATR